MACKKFVPGFTLIEMLIAIAIIAIISAIAYPSYINSVQKSRRTDATTSLSEAAALQEKWYFQHNQYSNNMNDLGGSNSREGFYSLSVDQPCGSANCFRLVATAVGAQSDDAKCKVFTLDNARAKLSFSDSAGGTATNDCW